MTANCPAGWKGCGSLLKVAVGYFNNAESGQQGLTAKYP
jgi:hypothetical protein